MKKILISMLMGVVLSVPALAASVPPDIGALHIQKLYAAYGDNEDLNTDIFSTFFSQPLAQRYAAIQTCSAETGEPLLDWNLLYTGQDNEDGAPFQLSIKPAQKMNYAVSFYVFKAQPTPLIELKYQLIKTGKGVQIRDIVYPDGTTLEQVFKSALKSCAEIKKGVKK